MLGIVLSQLALWLLSAILGGYGIFCVVMSFDVPEFGAEAILLLLTAAAILHFCLTDRR